jgi:flagellin
MNRLDYTDKTLQIQRENITAAESRIRDADVSLEMTAFVRQQILMQAGTSMLAQANQKPQSIMQLLQ